MKKALPLVAIIAAMAAGCGDTSNPGTAANGVSNAVTAPVNYLGAVVQAEKHAEKVIDVSAINQAIQMFQVSEGRLPKTLHELVPNYIGKIPEAPFGSKIVYDAAIGTVKVIKQ